MDRETRMKAAVNRLRTADLEDLGVHVTELVDAEIRVDCGNRDTPLYFDVLYEKESLKVFGRMDGRSRIFQVLLDGEPLPSELSEEAMKTIDELVRNEWPL